ncbi:MAG: hypothetical protein V7K27_07365 [Nostoc sp.]|uniref:DUF7219 family protein n=1 Tax=Nostoc sp. TaxID=1180 RepID=UPI002FFC1011
MAQSNYEEKNSFLYPRSSYYGQVKPKNLVFNANLQEFTQRISYITNLETGGKISSEEAFSQIEALWKQLERSKNKLEIGSDLSV